MTRTIKYSFLILTYGLLLLPIIGMILPKATYQNCEKRSLATFPSFTFDKDVIRSLESYSKDHFVFRNLNNHLSSKLKYKLFNSSSQPSQVVVGHQGWFYYSSVSDQLISSYARTDLWRAEELESKVQVWEKRKAALATEGKIYEVVIFPNKPTIYPEFLPTKMKRLVQGSQSKADQIMNYCERNESTISPSDYRKLLLHKKEKEQLYHQHDSHWNDLGAFYVYQKLLTDLGMTPYELEDFELSWELSNDGDLTALMGLCNESGMSESIPKLRFRGQTAIKKIAPEQGPTHYINPQAVSDQTILVFRDSYFSALIPFLSLHFDLGYYPWSYYDQKLVDELRPDIILSANVERRL